MKTTILIFTTASVVFFSNCQSNTHAVKKFVEQTSTQVFSLPQNHNRSAKRDSFLLNARMIAKTSKTPMAEIVFDFLEKNNVLGIPDLHGVKFLEAAKNNDWIAIVPIFADDSSVGPQWNTIVNAQDFIANFIPETKSLMLRTHVAMSPVWQGIATLHEGYHAYIFATSPYEQQTDEEYAAEELIVHKFQNEITNKIGGKKYALLLADEITRLKNESVKQGLSIDKQIPNRGSYTLGLDKVFGKAQSDLERGFRQTSFWLQACFQLYDEEIPGSSEHYKELLLLSLYKQSGIR